MGVLKKRTFDCINVDIDKDSNVCQESVTFIIPYLQRAYKWKEKQAKQMLEDFSEFLKQEKTYYCMQPLAVVKIGDNKYELLDGQQRLTTLLILWRILFESDEKTSYPYKFEYERDSSESNTLINRYSFITESDEIKKGEYGNIDEYYMSKVYGAIKLYFDNPNNKKTDEQKADNYKETFKKLLKGEGKHILFLWYEVNEEEKHTTFAHLNSGKIELTCSELIKAILLSDGNKDEMRDVVLKGSRPQDEQLAISSSFYKGNVGVSADQYLYVDMNQDKDVFLEKVDTTKRVSDYMIGMKLKNVRKVSLSVPKGMRVQELPAPFASHTHWADLSCTFSKQGNRVVMKKEYVIKNRRVALKDIPAWNKMVSEWNDACNQQVVILTK